MLTTPFIIGGTNNDTEFSGIVVYAKNLLNQLCKSGQEGYYLTNNKLGGAEIHHGFIPLNWCEGAENECLSIVQRTSDESKYPPVIVNNLLFPIFGYKLSEEMIRKVPVVSFVHQFSILPYDAKKEMLNQIDLSHHVIFLSPHEFTAVNDFAGEVGYAWRKGAIAGRSTITNGQPPSINPESDIDERSKTNDIATFTLFRFGKGCPQIAELAENLGKDASLPATTLHVAGHVVPGKGDALVFLKYLIAKAYGIPVEAPQAKANDLSIDGNSINILDARYSDFAECSLEETKQLLFALQGDLKIESADLTSGGKVSKILERLISDKFPERSDDVKSGEIGNEELPALIGKLRVLPMELHLDLTNEEVSNLLTKCKFAYGHQEDSRGINCSSSTYPSFWVHKCISIGPHGTETPDKWKDFICNAEDGKSAYQHVKHLINNPEEALEIQKKASKWLARNQTWPRHATVLNDAFSKAMQLHRCSYLGGSTASTSLSMQETSLPPR